MVKAHLVESAAQHASAAAFSTLVQRAQGVAGVQTTRVPDGVHWRGKKAFQLISKQYESASQALLRDWVFENSDQEPDEDDENARGGRTA